MKVRAGLQRRASSACYTALLCPLSPRFIELGEQVAKLVKDAALANLVRGNDTKH